MRVINYLWVKNLGLFSKDVNIVNSLSSVSSCNSINKIENLFLATLLLSVSKSVSQWPEFQTSVVWSLRACFRIFLFKKKKIQGGVTKKKHLNI